MLLMLTIFYFEDNDDGRDRNVKRSRPHPRIEDVTRRLCQDICEIGESVSSYKFTF